MQAALFMQGISIEEMEALIRKVIKEEVCSYFVELEGKKVSPHLCPKDELSDNLLSRKETAALLGISLPTLNDWTNKGVLKSHLIGRKVFYKVDEVNNALVERKPKYKRNS